MKNFLHKLSSRFMSCIAGVKTRRTRSITIATATIGMSDKGCIYAINITTEAILKNTFDKIENINEMLIK